MCVEGGMPAKDLIQARVQCVKQNWHMANFKPNNCVDNRPTGAVLINLHAAARTCRQRLANAMATRRTGNRCPATAAGTWAVPAHVKPPPKARSGTWPHGQALLRHNALAVAHGPAHGHCLAKLWGSNEPLG